MARAATPLCILLFIAFGLQLVAVISVPIIKVIVLASYDDYRFGVFGYCTESACSDVRIGYPSSIVDGDDDDFSLPSNARHSLTNLLIVHPIAAGLTLILLVLSIIAHFPRPAASPRYLVSLLIFSVLVVIVCLLAFLVDILLFIPHLSWGGWLVLAATVLLAVSSILLCTMRRTLSARRAMRNRLFADNPSGEVRLNHIPFDDLSDRRSVYDPAGDQEVLIYGSESKLAVSNSTSDEDASPQRPANEVPAVPEDPRVPAPGANTPGPLSRAGYTPANQSSPAAATDSPASPGPAPPSRLANGEDDDDEPDVDPVDYRRRGPQGPPPNGYYPRDRLPRGGPPPPGMRPRMPPQNGSREYVPPRMQWGPNGAPPSTRPNHGRQPSADYYDDTDPQFAGEDPVATVSPISPTSGGPRSPYSEFRPPPLQHMQSSGSGPRRGLPPAHQPQPRVALGGQPFQAGPYASRPIYPPEYSSQVSSRPQAPPQGSSPDSVSSQFTSVSQRPVNARYYQQGPPQQLSPGAPPSQQRRGPDRTDLMLRGNPDFQLPGAGPGRRAGGSRALHTPAALDRGNDSPYGAARHPM
ncbi:SUR7/PalI family-domain-containing protein [Limtongia smithiae]|uniref:SUR7/PalI family-domain-containing protein n=1 Tax=Limtongia smithiae TaxID=1125753 RepID=UPI0034CE1F18